MSGRREPRYVRAVAIGLAAGLLASYAMEQAQAGLTAVAGEPKSKEEPSTVKAADKLSEAVRHAPVPEPERETAGRAVHYATGAVLGALYALLAERTRVATAGFGALYGLLVSAVLDEALVPALKLSPPPNQVTTSAHVQGLAAHVAYGVALEAGRRTLDTVFAMKRERCRLKTHQSR